MSRQPRELRRELLYYFLRNHPEGEILPRWARIVRAFLFPIQAIYWTHWDKFGYDIYTDTYKLNGVRISLQGLYLLSRSDGQLFRATRTGDTITITHIQEPSA